MKGRTAMFNEKRISIFCGHYGSGKTNLAVNYAFYLKNKGHEVTVLDIDIINPYFRTKDSEKEFCDAGIELIASDFANSSLDMPVLPAKMYGAVQDKSAHCVLDVGGDDRGSVALGGFVPYIKEENNYEMFYVVNFYRPHTQNAEDALAVMRTIEETCGLEFSAVINNSCFGAQTTPDDVVATFEEANKLCKLSALPLAATSVMQTLLPKLEGKCDNLFALNLQAKPAVITRDRKQ
ncbi:MAG: hypothetical protein ACI4GY_02475 [Acutalibacteraceae bacterium]